MNDLQKIINGWQLSKFPDATEFDYLNKLGEEFRELAESVELGHASQTCFQEMADVAIALMGLAGSMGCDLNCEIMTKMGINMGRDWLKMEDGSYHHV